MSRGFRQQSESTSRAAFTLVELMVAITVVVILAAVALPVVTTFMSDVNHRGVPGAVRILQSTFALARNKALRDAAPYGVRLVRDPDNPWVVTRLQYLQTPPTYAIGGVSVGLQFNGSDDDGDSIPDDTTAASGPGVPDGFDNDNDGQFDEADELVESNMVLLVYNTQWFGVIRVGDRLRVNNSGDFYKIVGPDVNPSDGLIDFSALNLLVACPEPFPNRDGLNGIPLSRGFPNLLVAVPYQIFRQPEPAQDQEEVLLPRGAGIDLLRSKYLPGQISLQQVLAYSGNDNRPGIAGIDDDANGVPDDATELGTPGSGDVPPAAWPTIDIIFDTTGQVTGDAAHAAVMHFWLAQLGTTATSAVENAVFVNPADLAGSRLLSLYTRGGNAQSNEVGPPTNPYQYADLAYGARSD